ncbi:MAG: aspartate ammonia-lyase [Bacilli bacterium]|jgi:aspartate ammonia-lyase
MRYRIETDSLGEMQVPAEAYYGIQTLRAKENFQITKRGINRQMIKGLAIVKKAAARANADIGMLDEEVAKAIMLSCDEILNGRLHGQFITDVIQGGAGTSMNMNANEVIANRANEMMGGEKGKYNFVHPLDHVNFSQSTNDVIPTAGKIATIRQTKKLLVELKKLQNAYLEKMVELNDVFKLGRTHLQEAVPMRMGQMFEALASLLGRDIDRIEQAMDGLRDINMGATAIGTGLNANPKYIKKVVQYISKYTGENFRSAKNLIDSTRHLDALLTMSTALKILAVNLSKTANDLRLMASSAFHEINLPKVQPGSSIMPGKVNPVIPEVVNQVAFYVMGLDVTITKAVEAGQLELNVFEPVILDSLFEMLNTLRRAARTLREKAIEGLTANSEYCEYVVEHSPIIVTALSPHLGYNLSAKIAQEAMETGKSVRDIVLENKYLTEMEANIILDLHKMTTPGINGEELLYRKKTKKEE